MFGTRVGTSVDELPRNLLLPSEEQNSEWFQVTGATLVHYNILQQWHCLKMAQPGYTFGNYCMFLATHWGVSDRQEKGIKPPLNTIPFKTSTRMTTSASSKGNRYFLNEKRFAQAIVKSSICMILNDRAPDHR